LVQNHFA